MNKSTSDNKYHMIEDAPLDNRKHIDGCDIVCYNITMFEKSDGMYHLWCYKY